MTTELPPIAAIKDRAWREHERIDGALARGEIDDAGWHAQWQAVVTPAFLAGEDPRAQSGVSGDAAHWEATRRPILRAVDRDGDFLDIGCANGHLLECLHDWAAEDGMALEPYGLDISPELADLARHRLPQWTDRIWVGNALHWTPPRRFDYVRTGLEYVPANRRPDLVRHLLAHVVGRRLIIGMNTEERGNPEFEAVVRDMGLSIAGSHEIPHRDPRCVRRVFWLDREDAA